jgi:hypothetical protein
MIGCMKPHPAILADTNVHPPAMIGYIQQGNFALILANQLQYEPV